MQGEQRFEGLTYYQSNEDAHTFYFLPDAPSIKRDERGRPMVSLMEFGDQGLLQLQTRWDAGEDVLDKLRRAIAGEQGIDNPDLVRLSPAPVDVEKASLYLGDGSGTWERIHSATTSGFYPYDALFSVTLSAEQKHSATAALNGREGFVAIQYQASRTVEKPAKVTLSGDVPQELKRIGSHDREELKELLRKAVQQGRLTVDRTGEPGISEPHWNQTEQLVFDRATETLERMANDRDLPRDETTLSVSVTQTETEEETLGPSLDLGRLFNREGATDHVRPTGLDLGDTDHTRPEPEQSTAGSTTTQTARTVRLGFDPEPSPLALIQVQIRDRTSVMQPPDFVPVELGDDVDSVRLDVLYAGDNEPYETTFPVEGDDVVLSPILIGMHRVIVDGTGLPDRNVEKARVHVVYQPDGEGHRDDRTIYFRHDHWKEEWFIVTKSEGLDGTLEVEWKETRTDGSIEHHDRREVPTTEIVL